MRKFALILTLVSLFVLTISTAAFAAIANVDHQAAGKGDRGKDINWDSMNCNSCHAGDTKRVGPHGGYTTATNKCQTCHDVHTNGSGYEQGAENAQLLHGQTLTAACQYCHDLTATNAGPYNMSIGTLAPVTKSAHRVVGIDVYGYTDTEGQANTAVDYELVAGVESIPGGNATDGSAGAYSSKWFMYGTYNRTGDDSISWKDSYPLGGAVFTCNSCHTPHGVNDVKAYLGESPVKLGVINDTGDTLQRSYLTSRILKKRPNGVTTDVTEYNSSWCAGCHQGRTNLVTTHKNHPVSLTAPGYKLIELAWYKDLFWNAYATPAAAQTAIEAQGYIDWSATSNKADLKADPRSNMQFALSPGHWVSEQNRNVLRPDGYDAIIRTQNGWDWSVDQWVYTASGPSGTKIYDDGPACQQCHGSHRDVDAAFSVTPTFNGSIWVGGEPYRYSFPHVSTAKALLTEEDDDFCTNCHQPDDLP